MYRDALSIDAREKQEQCTSRLLFAYNQVTSGRLEKRYALKNTFGNHHSTNGIYSHEYG